MARDAETSVLTREQPTAGKVLLVDDSPGFLKVVASQLRAIGFDVTVASSGLEGLEVFFDAQYDHQRAIDVVLTDITMPDFDGRAVLGNIKARSPETPVIMLTSEEEMNTVRMAMRDGAHDYVLKNEGPKPLIAAIEKAVEEARKLRGTYQRIEDPLRMLQELAVKRAQGELVVVADALEVHVHVYGGKIAWATSSRVKYAFTRYLVEECGVEPDVIKVIVEECRQKGRKIGESLIEQNVASLEQVRTGLGQQMRNALSSLRGLESAQVVFLPRKASYSSTLIFDLVEVLPQ